jgi:hypothetical protein
MFRSPGARSLIWALLIFPLAELHAQSQSLYSYQELSHLFYARQKDSLKKAWACPSFYKQKETQKKYKEFWDERTDFITGAITADNYVHDKDICNYIQGIIDQIVAANRNLLPERPLLLLDRSPSVNAYSTGGNLIAVNLGLISFARSREELALVIAHELSHNILNHPENSMKERAEWFTSDEYKKSLSAVLDSKYERLTRLKKVFSGYSFDRSRHQRYHESDADSLAIVLLKKSNIPFNARVFLRLDSADLQYRQPLKTSLGSYFTSYNLPFDEAWTKKRSKGLSTHNYNFRDTTGIEDSLKTHPDCAERYARTLSLSIPNAKETPIPASIRETADKMLIWNMYNNMALTQCLYRIFLQKDQGSTDKWYDFMVNNIFAALNYSDRQLHRFNAVGIIPKEYISKNYYELQTMLEQMPRETLETYCKTLQNEGFWTAMPPAERALKNLLSILALDPDDSDKNKARAAKEFAAGNSSSMYYELANNFEKK